jgi:hypothetical protein
MENFSSTTTNQLDETERSVSELRMQINKASKAGGAVIEDIMRASQAALSHLQFQDVVAQDLRQLDSVARAAQLEALNAAGADAGLLAEVPPSDYATVSDGQGGAPVSAPGEVLLL